MTGSYISGKRGDIYLADLGTPAGSVHGGVRPVINIQNNTGSFFGPTLIVIPLTTELKKQKHKARLISDIPQRTLSAFQTE